MTAKHPRKWPPGHHHRALPPDLVPILDDLRVGLARRAARRRHARAGAATALSTLLLAGVGISTAGRIADAGSASPSGAATVLLSECPDSPACWTGDVNLPKHRSYHDR